jgi:ring-1,2-phenylacetyl-CoA epoxidase subunit PaaB
MPYEVHLAPGDEPEPEAAGSGAAPEGWPMWEVFVRARRGMSHGHAGSLHAPDAETALQHARDVYTRRREGVSLWVVPSDAITASDPADGEELFEAIDKPYRHATYYEIPEEVGHM